ncbi:MAG: aspartate carbamoyltransferase catalytic subunit, partial [Lysobacter sp.]
MNSSKSPVALKHLLSLADLSRAQMLGLLDRAQRFADGREARQVLAGTAVCTLFFEPSTRTRMSFQLAAQRLGADVLNFDVSTSSAHKGETARDTLKNMEAMGVRGFIVRHQDDGAVAELADAVNPGTVLINAGDGRSAHPTQGLLDVLTLRQARGDDFKNLRVLIVGDVKHSRVARSDLHALRTLGAREGDGRAIEIRVCGPRSLLPQDSTLEGCVVSQDFDAAIDGVDAVMMLRLQRERMDEGLVTSLDDYHRDYGLNAHRLKRAAADAVVLHPG